MQHRTKYRELTDRVSKFKRAFISQASLDRKDIFSYYVDYTKGDYSDRMTGRIELMFMDKSGFDVCRLDFDPNRIFNIEENAYLIYSPGDKSYFTIKFIS